MNNRRETRAVRIVLSWFPRVAKFAVSKQPQAAGLTSLAIAMFFVVTASAVAESKDAIEPDWKRPAAQAVRARAIEWLAGQKLTDAERKKATAIWDDLADSVSGTDLLARVGMTFAAADRRAATLVELCSKPREGDPLPAQDWLSQDGFSQDGFSQDGLSQDGLLQNTAERSTNTSFVAANLRLLYGRWLARESMYDEAAGQLDGLQPEDVVDPDSLLFFQAIVHHRLLQKDKALATVERLLQRADDCPRRYRSLAQLMQADLQGLKDESLDHIARRMEDVRRRLDLGRPGDKTRKVEDGIIESLDKVIKKLEQQQQQKSGSGSGGNNTQPSNPAGDSQPMGGRGPGRVVKRGVGAKSGWGDLPAKDREEALQQVSREFPAHYREVIEQYFRKLADKEE